MSKREWSASDQTQMHGNEASKKRSGHLIADMGHHCEVICTVRYSNCEPVDEDDDDRKLPARREVPCASPPVDEDDDDQKLPARREVPWEEEEEEEEEEEVIPVNHPVNHPNDEETSLMMKAFTNKSSTSNVVLGIQGRGCYPIPQRPWRKHARGNDQGGDDQLMGAQWQ
jgi:hypothetical protein